MLITVKKEVEETIEMQTPCWMANPFGFYAHITESGDLIEVFGNTVSLKEAGPATEVAISNLVKDYHCCSEAEFKEALDKRLYKLEETITT